MKSNKAYGLVLSFALHAFVLIGLYIAIPVKPLADIEPSISVSIISDTNTSLGDTSINKQSPKDATDDGDDSSSLPKEETNTEALQQQDIKPQVLPPPKIGVVQPKQQASQPIIQPKALPPKTLPPKQVPPKPISPKDAVNPKLQTPQKALPKPAQTPNNAKPQTNASKSPAPKIPAAKNNNGFLSSAFDIPAASSSAGTQSRSSPKLSNGTAKRTGNSTALRGDLNAVLREQVKHCWREPADLSNPQSLIVELDIELTLEGRLARQPKLLKPLKTGANSSQLIAIDNALSAARNCAPFDLPSERYDEWQRFVFRFNPSELRR